MSRTQPHSFVPKLSAIVDRKFGTYVRCIYGNLAYILNDQQKKDFSVGTRLTGNIGNNISFISTPIPLYQN